MIIIFYDANKEEIYICSDKDKTKIVPVNDPDLLSYIPNDDILYIQNAHFVTKRQFGDWLSGELVLTKEEEYEPHRFTGFMNDEVIHKPVTSDRMNQDAETRYRKSLFLHPKHHGSIIINDLKNEIPLRSSNEWKMGLYSNS